MKKNYFIKTIFILVFCISAHSQTLVWTGGASNNNFFDEGNWRDTNTNSAPISGSIDPGIPANMILQINNFANVINASGGIDLGTGSLSVTKAAIIANSLRGAGGTLTMNEDAYVDLTDATPILTSSPRVQINFTSGLSWIKTTKFNARFTSATYVGQIKVNGNSAVYKTNLRFDNYYQTGCVIRSNEATTTPLAVYDNTNLQGNPVFIPVNKVHKANEIPSDMNNKIESFVLKKGFMLTIANEDDGTGKSKNYIASESDLIINELPKLLKNKLSFIRVMHWNWVTKKGRNDVGIDLNSNWRYQWNPNDDSTVNWEFAPMAWGHTSANDDADIASFIGRYNTPYIMSFNEPDDCEAQSGQYGDLCKIDIAVGYHKNLMKTGMRIVSPAGREEAPFGWLKDFYEKATKEDVRVDVIGVHWYDWGSNPTKNPNPTAQEVFNRFKTYIIKVHDLYGLPIWITEFNANPARSQTINAGFIALALPWLESLDYIERYCWFPYNTGTHFYGWNDANNPKSDTTISLVGTAYKNQVSTPSIPDATVNVENNLNLSQYNNIALGKPATANSSFSATFDASKAVDGDITTTNSRWLVNFGDVNGANRVPLPAWIEVDLQGTYTIDSIKIVEESSAVKDFAFQYWDTTLNSGAGGWSNAFSVTGNPRTPLTFTRTFSEVTTTKVRLYITAHNHNSYLRLFELEVYGYASNTLGVSRYEKQQFSIYPNPVSEGFLNIEGAEEVKSVIVYNSLGVKVNIKLKNNKILIDALSPGIYFLRINNQYSYKFLKN